MGGETGEYGDDRSGVVTVSFFFHGALTSTETIRLIRDGERRKVVRVRGGGGGVGYL